MTTTLRAGRLYLIPLHAEIASWARARNASGVTLEQLCSDLEGHLNQSGVGSEAHVTRTGEGAATVQTNVIAADVFTASVRWRPAVDTIAVDARYGLDPRLIVALNGRLAGVPDRDRFRPFISLLSFTVGSVSHEPIIADPVSSATLAPSGGAGALTSVLNTRDSTDPAIDETSPAGAALRNALSLPPWATALIAGGAVIVGIVATLYVLGKFNKLRKLAAG